MLIAPYGVAQSLAYDAIGDRISESTNGTNTSYVYTSNTHQLASTSGGQAIVYRYDASGNQTQRGTANLVYDTRGRMTSVSGSASAQYIINGAGQRVQKTVGSQTTRFVYDTDGKLLGEYDGSGNVIEETIYLGALPVLLNQPAIAGGAAKLYAIYADNLGTPRQIAGSTGVSRWQWWGEPFGATLPNGNPANAGLFTYNLRFPGQYYDNETGLSYNYYRDYESGTGRYIKSDPAGLGGGISTYGYALEEPLRYTDPFGLWVRRCMRWLHGLGNGGTNSFNPFAHHYLDISGAIVGYGSAGNGFYGGSRYMRDENPSVDNCSQVCDDPAFDGYVREAIKDIGLPTYSVLGLFGVNCQDWTDMVLLIAKSKYLADQKCPKCFR